MNDLARTVEQVEAVFANLDQEIASFQSRTKLHCAFGCGKCCFKPDIEATSLEFLPFANHLYEIGQAESWYERLRQTQDPICLILNPTQGGAGLCSEYKYRGLICRLFGYSARTNKYQQRELVTCQVIKTEQASNFADATAGITAGEPVPVMANVYMQLHSIDPGLATEFYPINRAILRALELVMHYYAYRR